MVDQRRKKMRLKKDVNLVALSLNAKRTSPIRNSTIQGLEADQHHEYWRLKEENAKLKEHIADLNSRDFAEDVFWLEAENAKLKAEIAELKEEISFMKKWFLANNLKLSKSAGSRGQIKEGGCD